jgi:hypothetical protein
MKITTNVTMKTNIACPACKTKFPAIIDKGREVIQGQCPQCGKTVSLPGTGVIDALSKRMAEIGTATENAVKNKVDAATISFKDTIAPTVDPKMKRIALICNIAGGVVTLWTLFYPRPYLAAVAVSFLLPMVFLVVLWVSQGAIRLVDSKKGSIPYLTVGFIGPMLALALRGLLDFTPESFRPVLHPLLTFSFAMTLLVWLATREMREKIGKLLLVLPFVIAFGYGAIMEANCLVDISKPAIYDAKVISKRISVSKRSKTYYLTVPPWGPRRENNEITVSRKQYESVNVNDPVSIGLKQGRFNIPWYRMLPVKK